MKTVSLETKSRQQDEIQNNDENGRHYFNTFSRVLIFLFFFAENNESGQKSGFEFKIKFCESEIN